MTTKDKPFGFTQEETAAAVSRCMDKRPIECEVEATKCEAVGDYVEAAIWWRAAQYSTDDHARRSMYERAEVGALRKAGR